MHQVTLSVGGATHEVVRLDAQEAVSTLFQLDVQCAPSAATGGAPEAGQTAVLNLADGLGNVRAVTGLVSEARTRYSSAGNAAIELTLRPAAYPLTMAQNCRAFQDKTVIDIVSEVLAGVPHRWEVTGSYPPKPYVVQYREQSWAFVCRLLEEAGIYYWFDHAAGSMLVLSDESQAAPALSGGANIEVQVDRALRRDREVLFALGETARVEADRYCIRSFNPLHPDLPIEGSAGGGDLEWYDAPMGGPLTAAECQQQAQLALKAAASACGGVSGQSSSVRLVPGRRLDASGHPLGRLDGGYFITSVSYQVRPAAQPEGGVTSIFTLLFAGVAQAASFGPARATLQPVHSGLQTAWVVGPGGMEIYNDSYGRVRVQQHWDRLGGRDELSGTWQRVAQRGTADSLLTPRIGWNVLTFSEEGAGHAPGLLNRLHDAEHPPAYPLPAHKTRLTFKTATTPVDGSYNEIRFEDLRGSEQMLLNASRDMTVQVKQVSTEGVDRDVTRRIGGSRTLLVVKEVTEDIKGSHQAAIGGDQHVAIAGSEGHQVSGAQSVAIGGPRKLDCDAATLSVKSTRELSVGSALIDCSLGQVDAVGGIIALKVGGAYAKLALQSITEAYGGVSAQTIGAAKLEFVRGERRLSAKRGYFETVGGLFSLKTDKAYRDVGREKAKWTAGARLAAKAPTILIEAADKIEVKCGKSSLILTPDCVELCSTTLDLSSSDLMKIKSEMIKHN